MNTTVIGALCFVAVLIGMFIFLATKKSEFKGDVYPPSPLPDSPEPSPTKDEKGSNPYKQTNPTNPES